MDFNYRIWILCSALVILGFEIVKGGHRGIYNRKVLLVTALCFLVGGVTSPLAGQVIRSVVDWVMAPTHLKGALKDVPLVWGTLGVLFVADFFFYWGHRFAHRKIPYLGWLGKLHRTHHSGKFMNITLTARIHPLWYFVVPAGWVYAIAAYLGLGTAALYAVTVVFTWNLFTHTHFRWDDWLRNNPRLEPILNVLEHVLITPGLHHTHHGWGSDDGKTYRNFAVMFALFDWMFGTLHRPKGRPRHYGLPGDYPHWAEEVFYPFYQQRKPK